MDSSSDLYCFHNALVNLTKAEHADITIKKKLGNCFENDTMFMINFMQIITPFSYANLTNRSAFSYTLFTKFIADHSAKN